MDGKHARTDDILDDSGDEDEAGVGACCRLEGATARLNAKQPDLHPLFIQQVSPVVRSSQLIKVAPGI